MAEGLRFGKIITAPAAIALQLGYPPGILDDVRLGFRSGRVPDGIAMDDEYRAYRAGSDAERRYRDKLLSSYVSVKRVGEQELLVKSESEFNQQITISAGSAPDSKYARP